MLVKNTESQLIEGILRHGPEILEQCVVDPNDISLYIERLYLEHLNYPIPKNTVDINHWNIPKEYADMDIEGFLVSVCPKENYERLIKELDLYQKNNMISVLRAMKYVVDTLRANNVVWGVGRGSSVASYVLYLIGVHKIDSIKYKLPIEEFFKEI